jgi:WD40 repeat protein
LWEAATGKEVRTLSGHSDAVRSISLSPDGKYLASGSEDNTIKLWEVISGKEVKTLVGHTGWVLSISFSPDRKYLASGSWDGTAKLWYDMGTNEK